MPPQRLPERQTAGEPMPLRGQSSGERQHLLPRQEACAPLADHPRVSSPDHHQGISQLSPDRSEDTHRYGRHPKCHDGIWVQTARHSHRAFEQTQEHLGSPYGQGRGMATGDALHLTGAIPGSCLPAARTGADVPHLTSAASFPLGKHSPHASPQSWPLSPALDRQPPVPGHRRRSSSSSLPGPRDLGAGEHRADSPAHAHLTLHPSATPPSRIPASASMHPPISSSPQGISSPQGVSSPNERKLHALGAKKERSVIGMCDQPTALEGKYGTGGIYRSGPIAPKPLPMAHSAAALSGKGEAIPGQLSRLRVRGKIMEAQAQPCAGSPKPPRKPLRRMNMSASVLHLPALEQVLDNGCASPHREAAFRVSEFALERASAAGYQHLSSSAKVQPSNSGLEAEAALALSFRKDLGWTEHVLRKEYESIDRSYVLADEEIASGQFGVIRRCMDSSTGSIFACKTICKDKIRVPASADDVRREVACLMHLRQHRSFPRLHATFEDLENIHIVTELCRGGDLHDHVSTHGCVSESDAAELCVNLVKAVAYCHSQGIMHRDIKPENVLLKKKKSFAAVKLVDFGVATFFHHGEIFTDFVGTLDYMAPEVLKRSYSKESDIWSIGSTLYFVLCGHPPFWESSEQTLMKAILHEDVTFKPPRWSNVSPLCCDLLSRMLTKDPKERITLGDILDSPWLDQHLGS